MNLVKKRSILFVGWAGLAAGCGEANFGGNSDAARSQASRIADDQVLVDVTYQHEDAAGLFLASSNALEAYAATLGGGVDCWGGKTLHTSGTPLVVKKDAKDCTMTFTSLTIKVGTGAVTMTPGAGGALSSSMPSATRKEYSNGGAAPISLSVNVAATFNTAASSAVALFGRQVDVQATPVAVTSEEIPVDAGGNVLAAPHVGLDGAITSFAGTLKLKVKCAQASSEASKCVPAVTGTAFTAQPLGNMRAAFVNVASAGYPASINATFLDGAFRLSVVASVSGHTATFANLGFTKPTSTEKGLVVIRYSEGTAPNEVFSYRVIPVNL